MTTPTNAEIETNEVQAQDNFYENLFGLNTNQNNHVLEDEANTSKSADNQETQSQNNNDNGIVEEEEIPASPASILISEHESHCNSCINVRQCKKQQRLASTSSFSVFTSEVSGNSGGEGAVTVPVIKCPIILCRLKCGHAFHECKRVEHEELICAKKKVACLNVNYGCPFRMERKYTGVHLKTCPASVVVCTVEWNRKPLAPWQSEHFESYAANSQDLDIAAAKRDEQTVKEYYKLLPQSLRSLLKSNDKKQTIMPLGVAGTRIPNSILNQTVLEKNALKKLGGANLSRTAANNAAACADKLEDTLSTNGANNDSSVNDQEDHDLVLESDEDDDDSSSLISYSEPSYGIRKSPSAGLQQSVCSQLISVAITTTAADEESQNSPTTSSSQNQATPSASKSTQQQQQQHKKSHVRLSPIVDVVVKDACKYMNLFTFMCSHEFRRDEYAGHFQTVHTQIITQLNGWLFTRCPMAMYGCNFGVERMYPIYGHKNNDGGGSDKDNLDNLQDENKYEIIRNASLDSFCYRQLQPCCEPPTMVGQNHFVDKTDDHESINTQDNNEENENVINQIGTEIKNDVPTLPLNICDLPIELLVHLTTFLDPLSLNALTLTNTLFLSICQTIVAERGIVVLDWEKKSLCKNSNDENEDDSNNTDISKLGGWEVVEKRWMFSKYFTPIRKWGFINPGLISNHMAKCQYFEEQRNRPAKPFCYPVTKDEL